MTDSLDDPNWEHPDAEWYRLEEVFGFDRRYGTDTTSLVESGTVTLAGDWTFEQDPAGTASYAPAYPGTVWTALHSLECRHEDFVFVDLGSGKGRILLCASDLAFKRLIGIEHDARLHAIAQRNVAIYRSVKQRCHTFELIHGNAEDVELPPENTIICVFNAFGPVVTKRVLERMRASFRANPREIYLVYLSLVPIARDLLDATSFMQKQVDGPDPGMWSIYKVVDA